jgi:HlyD family secretion protein
VSEPVSSTPRTQSVEARGSSREQNTELRIPELEGRARVRRYVLIALALAGLGYAYYHFTQKPPEAELYRTVPVQRRSLVQAVDAAGRLDVHSRVEVPAPAGGRLIAIHVTQGDVVKAGQLLAELDPRAAALAVRGAEAAVEAASGALAQIKARKEEAERALSRAKTLVARGLASPEDAANAQAELTQANAALEGARGEQKVASQTVASARLSQNLSRMEAPTAGVVLSAPERVGAAVGPEAGPLFVIGSALDSMRVDATVSETEVALIKPGQSAEVLVTALPGQKFKGRVERVFIEPEKRDGAVLYPIRLSVENPGRALLPGMTARARMEVARADNVLSVHEAAVRFAPKDAPPESAQRSRVWRRIGPLEVESVSVRAGLSDGMYVQIEPINGASLRENDALAVGLLRPDDGRKAPSVRLGDKK